jgi:hypothetical protein
MGTDLALTKIVSVHVLVAAQGPQFGPAQFFDQVPGISALAMIASIFEGNEEGSARSSVPPSGQHM